MTHITVQSVLCFFDVIILLIADSNLGVTDHESNGRFFLLCIA